MEITQFLKDISNINFFKTFVTWEDDAISVFWPSIRVNSWSEAI
jgi:hypothetical protein